MSWSINFIGSPENIIRALKEKSEQLSGLSKEEYDAALPHMEALVNQNYSKNELMYLKIDANGSGFENQYRGCNISITQLSGVLT